MYFVCAGVLFETGCLIGPWLKRQNKTDYKALKIIGYAVVLSFYLALKSCLRYQIYIFGNQGSFVFNL